MSSPSKPLVSQWDGLPRPGLTVRRLLEAVCRKGAARAVAGMRWLAVLSNQRAWLAWLCGLGALAVLGVGVAAVYGIAVSIAFPLLLVFSRWFTPETAPIWWRFLSGVVGLAVGLLLVRLVFGVCVTFPARLWVALSTLVKQADPESEDAKKALGREKTQARDWLIVSGLGWLIVAVGLIYGLSMSMSHASEWLDSWRQAQNQMLGSVSDSNAAIALKNDPKSTNWPDVVEIVDQQLDAVEQGRATTFDTLALKQTHWDLSSKTIAMALNQVSDQTRSDVMHDPLLIPTTLLVARLSARLNRLAESTKKVRTQALARGDQAAAAEAALNLKRIRENDNRALLVLEGQELGTVALASGLILDGGSNQKMAEQGYLERYYNTLSQSDYIRNGSGQLIPSQNNKTGYGCAPVVYSESSKGPSIVVPSTPVDLDIANGIAKRIEQIGGSASLCETDNSYESFVMWHNVLGDEGSRRVVGLKP